MLGKPQVPIVLWITPIKYGITASKLQEIEDTGSSSLVPGRGEKGLGGSGKNILMCGGGGNYRQHGNKLIRVIRMLLRVLDSEINEIFVSCGGSIIGPLV